MFTSGFYRTIFIKGWFAIFLFTVLYSQRAYAQCGVQISANSGASIVFNDVLCKGDSTGEIILSTYTSINTGSNYPYTWSIYQGSTSGPIVMNGTAADRFAPVVSIQTGDGDLQNIPAGTYILVTCNNLGQQLNNITITISEPSVLFSASLTSTSPPSCAGTCTNSAIVTGNGGNPNYNFTWSTGQSNSNVASATALNLCAGNYSVTVSDQNTCDTIIDFTIGASPLPIADAGTDQLLCSGASGVTIGGSPTGSGASSPYTFSWNNAATLSSPTDSNPTASPSVTTTYTVTVTDAIGCAGTDDVTVTLNPAITIATTQTNVSCFGGSDGLAVADASGGTSPFVYEWDSSPVQADDSASNLTIGTYSVTATDANNCTQTASVTITEPTLLTVNITSLPISCDGINDGSLTANPLGGTTNYSYLWSTGSTNQQINNLGPGTYCVTVTDSKGCDTSACFDLIAPSAIVANLTFTDITCNGACNGTASVSPSGGVSPYTITWSGGLGTGSSVSNICPGSYTVTIGDVSGCSTATPFSITQPSAIAPNANATDVSCFGDCNGTTTSAPTGGTSPYTFNWDIPSTADTNTALCANTYNITVTDANGCVQTTSVIVNTPAALAVNLSSADVTCPDSCNGTATVAPSGGIPGYIILWSNDSATASISSLCPGAYSVTITDATTCTAEQSFTITGPATLTENLTTVDPTCNGASNGFATVAPAGGTSPYTFLWDDGSTNDTVTNFFAGNHSVNITDFNGCAENIPFSLNEPNAISTTMSQLDQTCSGFCDGIGNVNASGGTSPYTYLWSQSAQTDTTATGLCGGNNFVTVTDSNACTTVDTVIISSSVVITITSTIVNEDCNAIGCDGTATASATGGASPYNFIWSNGDVASSGTSSLADSLCQGTYYVSATDIVGCLSVDSIDMTVADSVLQVSDSVINVSCNGNCDGSIIALVTGGTGPGTYTYQWSGFPDTDSSIDNLCPGAYSMVVIDGNQCRDSLTNIAVTEPETLSASATGTDALCNGVCNGTATASGAGGTAPYTFLWSDGGGQTTQTATGLCAGTYFVTITDANGCADSANVAISEPNTLTAAATATAVSCNGGNNGTATVTVSGGTPLYSFVWSNAAVTQTITGLIAGSYCVTVTDANGCTITACATVSQPSALTVSASKTDALCNGQCNGTATANPSGGTSPFTYSWSNAQTTQTATGLCSGSFTVTVTDINGCTQTASVTIAEPSALSVSTSRTNPICNGFCDGTATATASNGTSPYTYAWSDGQSTQTATGLCNGTYTVTATDANNCTITAAVTVTHPPAISAIPNPVPSNCTDCDGTARFLPISGGTPGYSHSWNTGATTHPLNNVCAGIYIDTIRDVNNCQTVATVTVSNLNAPDGATIITNNATCYASCNGNAAIIAVSGGTSPYSYIWPDTETDTVMTSICASANILQITDAIGCILFQTFVIDEPDSLQAGIITADATCAGLSDGTATSNASGGTGILTYNWSTGATTSAITNLIAGTYPLTVTDNNNCTVLDTAVISDALSLTLSFSVTDVLCNGDSTGSVTANPSGGATPYSYLWSTGGTDSALSAVSANTYTVTVTDINGCSITDSAAVNVPSAISIASAVTDATCGLSDGAITVSASGGISPYAYNWSTGSTDSDINAVSAGNYTLTVTDANSCIKIFNIGVNNIDGPGTSASVTNATCNGVCDGTGTVTITSGVAPFTYLWVPGGQTTSSVTGLCAGNYNVEVTDSNNCATVQTVTVAEPPVITVSFSSTNVSCNGACDGTATVTASNGIIPYSYSWSTGSSAQFIASLCAGTYYVTITDGAGCAVTDSVTITQPSVLSASATGSTVACNGDCNGTTTVTASGGTAGYSYSWSSGATASVAASLCAGAYTATVTDTKGCTATATASVTQPSAISVTAILIQTTCGSCSGTITISPSGGTSPYTRLWSTGSTLASISNLCPNIYSLTVTDASGCTADTNFVMNNSDGPIPVLTGDTTTCFNDCDATATSTTSGGTPSYTFLWDDPLAQTTSSATGLCDGTYSLYVTDANGCIGIETTTITEPAQLTNSISTFNADCNTLCDVTATANVSGGTSPYAYAWDDPLAQTTPSATGLCSGTFFVTITDANGCERTDSIVINEISTLSLSITGTNANCFNSCDGTATANVSGGTSPYSYNWSNTETTPVITNLCIGTYTVTVTDNNGCVKIDSIIITEPAVLASSITGTDVNCNNGFDGSVNVSVSGGATPYSYNWSPSGQTDSTATGLSAGTHSVTITDANGCTIITATTISQPTALLLDSIVTVNTACGDTDGTATVFVSGGTTVLTYLWDDALAQTTQTATSLLQGVYAVTVTYNGACDTSFGGIVIANTNGAVVTMDSSGASCNGVCDGTATAIVTGGTTPYTYLWSDGQTDSIATGLCAGTYNISVTDGNTCLILASVSVTEPTLLIPTISGTALSCNGANDGSASISASGGTSPYTFLWSTGDNSSQVTNLPAQIYCVTVTDANGCDTAVCVTINEPAALSLTTSQTNASCNGSCNGDATVTVSGGITPYSYSWSNGQTSSTATGLCDGNYIVTITDANSCTIDTSFDITEPTLINAVFTQNQPACSDSNGTLTVNVSGGTPFTVGNPYTYLWSAAAQTDSTATGLAVGTYTVTATDSLGCSSVFSTNLSNLNAPVIVIDSIDSVSCSGLSDGNIFVTTTGINVPFTFQWSNGQTTEDAVNLAAGNDTLTVTDAAGCITIIDTVVSEPVLLTVNVTSTDATCSVCNGTATATISGGTGAYTYDWVNPQTTAAVTGLCAGIDSVIVADENGCTATANTTIINIPGPDSISFVASDVSCSGGNNGSVTATPNGGTSPYTYLWSTGSADSTLSAVGANTYSVTITDDNDCAIDSSITINEPSEIVADSIVVKNANCGAANGKAEIFASGGTPSYSYLWSEGSTSANQNGLSAGTYSVTVTDGNGCTKVFSGITVNNVNGPSVSLAVSDVTCNGVCNGAVTATIMSGISPFTFLWSNADVTPVADSLCAITYSVTVTDSLGCATIVADSVIEPVLLTATISGTNITCNGANNGSATVSAGGGTSPYTFLWNTGAQTQNIASLPAGNYCVTVTDTNGCDTTVCITINEPSALTIDSIVSVNVLCNGDSTGSAAIFVSGGITSYTYSWSNGASASSVSGLPSSVYTVTITDVNGCTKDTSLTLTEPNALVADSIVTTEATCLDSNGTATVFVSGGVSPYAYLWNDAFAQITPTADSLFIGSYSVTVTDSVLCSQTFANIIINNINAPTVSVTVTDINCSGDSTGAITVAASGGAAPYGFQWSTGQQDIFAFTSTADTLLAGEYTVTVSDMNGCMTVAVDTVNEPTLLTVSTSSTDVLCNGDATGSVTASVSGGTSPYTFLWSTGAQTQNITSLPAGNYCVTVTDTNGCDTAVCITINEPSALSVDSIISQHVLCNGDSSGSATIFVSGGTSPYSYLWNDGVLTNGRSSLLPGNYSVTITDVNGCTEDTSVTITEPNALVADSIVITDASCGISNGSITLYISGGISPYDYLWNDGQTDSSATGLATGIYSVTVTDTNGCSKVFGGLTVNNSNGPTVSTTKTNITCNGLCNGTITANASGSNTPFTYLWSNGDTTTTADSLCLGSHSVTVTNAIGCLTIITDSVSEPAILVISISATDAGCNGDSTGSATVAASGGTSPYTFLWNTGAQTQNIASLPVGNYCVTVTDTNGCDTAVCITINEPSALTIDSIVSVNVLCNGDSTGSAAIFVSGGITSYTYSWSNGASASSVSGLPSSVYTVTITDVNGCTKDTSVTITETNAIIADSIVTTEATCLDSNGTATVFVSGGVSPYAYLWDDAFAQTTPTASSLFIGSYSVTVTDSVLCSQTFANIIINNINAPTVSVTVTDINCSGDSTGAITVAALGGTAPYGFQWSTGQQDIFVFTSTADTLLAGEYTVTVSDMNGCMTVAVDTVNEPTLLTVSTSSTDVLCSGDSTGSVTVSVSGGTSPYTFLWSTGVQTQNITSLPAGNYCVTVTDTNGCDTAVCITINEPSALSVDSIISQHVLCNGDSSGSATVFVSGGTSPYSYLWSSGSLDSTLSAVSANIYSVTITDANICTKDTSVTITEPNVIVADSIVTTDATCLDSNGTATIFISGGTSPYFYLWNDGIQTNGNFSLQAGIYSVVVTDSNACSKAFSGITVNNTNGPIVSLSVSDATCNGVCNGSVTATITSGISPFTYLWSNADTTSVADSLCAITYSVTVTDSLGCSTIVADSVAEPALLTAIISGTDVSCNGASNGSATLLVAGGVSPYTFLWNTGEQTQNIVFLPVGNYCVTVTDTNGCDTTVCITINEPSALTVDSIVSVNVLCNGDSSGSAAIFVSGGTSGYSYSWSTQSGVQTITGLVAGTYSVTVTDTIGCTKDTSVTIFSAPAIVLDSSNTVPPPCGDSTGTATVFVSGGLSSYTYIWQNGDTSATTDSLKAGTYFVTVTDANLCTKTFSVSVSNPGAQTVTLAVTDVSCGASCNGKIIATATGGNVPYSFLWSNAETTDTIENLCPNVYITTVTDATGCIVIASDTVSAGNILTATTNITNVLCNGDSTGSIAVNVTDGTTPYTYIWNNGQTGATAIGLIAGNYCVTVNDSSGCSFADCYTVSQPDSALVLSISSTNPLCSGTCNGTATAAGSGGTLPYNYVWCNAATDSTITGLCAVTCGVTITDANSCAASATLVISAPSAITIEDSLSQPTCNTSNGFVWLINVSGGNPYASGYTYLWTTGETVSEINGKPAGTYCVTVTDSLGCFFDTCYALAPPPSAIVTVDSIVNTTCSGKCDGEIYISVAGNSPFTYQWSNADTLEDTDSLCAGTYFLTITDAFGCITTFDTAVAEPPAISISASVIPATCGLNDGVAVATVSGGTSPYSILWSNNDVGDTAKSLSAGAYTVTVTDFNGCSATIPVAVSNLGGPDSITFAITDASCSGSCNGAATATVFGGTSPYTYSWSIGDADSSIADVCAGTYTLSVTDSSGCLLITNVTINQPNAIDVAFVTTPPACGGSDGQISAVTSGGTPFSSGYTYVWSANAGGQTTSVISGLEADAYFVTVTDSLGCTQTDDTMLSNSDAIAFAFPIDANCFGTCNGSIVVTGSSGTNMPFTYLWLPVGFTDSSIFGLCAGNYTLEITDALGCKTFQDYFVSEPAQLSSSFAVTDAQCGQCNGTATINVSGGVSPYNYVWTNNDSGTLADSLCAGVYSSVVTDANGCQATFSTGINNSGSPVGSISSISDVTCFGLCDGGATVSASGGISPYSFFWVGSSPADTDSVATNLCAGSYFVEITGDNGCIGTIEVIINEPAGLGDSTDISPPVCGGNTGSIEVFISGGITPYDYLWSSGETTALIGNLIAGVYKLTVTDNGGTGCSQVFTYILNSAGAPFLTISGTDISCNSGCDGSATVTAIGGTIPYAYQWMNSLPSPINGQTDPTADSLCGGTYFAQVTDAASCVSSIQITLSEPSALDTSLIIVGNNSCFGECKGTATAVINGGMPPYTYLWNDGQIANPATALCSNSYTVTVSDTNNCKISQTVIISQPNQLVVDTNSVTNALCFDSNDGAVDINVSGGTTPYAYMWSNNTTTQDLNTVLPGNYSVTVTDTNFCDTTYSISIDTIITLTIEPLLDVQICQGKQIMLIANASGNSSIDYLWTPPVSLSNVNIPTPVASPGATQMYILTASINGQCAVSDSVVITVNPSPLADAGDGVTVVKGVTATVGGNPTAAAGTPPFTYAWSPAQGLDNPTGENPVALPSQTTMYAITVTDSKGCTATDSAEVTVVPRIHYNEGFSPNGDGVNDGWQIEFVEQFPELEVEIYNRWGQLLFKAERGYPKPWDGTYNGKPLPIGTYYYVIVLNHPKFPEPVTGPITILR